VVAEFSEWLSDGTKEGGVVDERSLLEVGDGRGVDDDVDGEASVGVDSWELSDGVSSCRRVTSGAVVGAGAGAAVTAWRQKMSASARIRYR
jgi:hypothetical protein